MDSYKSLLIGLPHKTARGKGIGLSAFGIREEAGRPRLVSQSKSPGTAAARRPACLTHGLSHFLPAIPFQWLKLAVQTGGGQFSVMENGI